jgi:LPXTG-site transpeptidase (sortase) family protein
MMSNGSYALRVTFAGANLVEPVAEAPATAGLGKVTYADLWDGISLTYDAPSGSIARSTYTLQPGADPSAIRLSYNAPVTLDESGNLTTRFDQSQVSESKPIAWQEIAGQRKAVEAAFTLNEVNGQQVGFALGSYDPTQTLYIDPLIGWTTFFGSPSTVVSNLSVDSYGNIFIVGYAYPGVNWTCSPTPCTRVALHDTDTNLSGNTDGFIAKLDPTGHLLWNTFLGNANFPGGNEERATDFAFDASGNIYVSGRAGGAWSWVDPSTKVKRLIGLSNPTGMGGYIAKLNSNGDLQWVVPGLGATSTAVDVNADIYVVGYASPRIFPDGTLPAPINVSYPGNSGENANSYAAKLDSNGNLKWHTFFGNKWLDNTQNQTSMPSDMKLDSKGNLVVLNRWANISAGNPGETSLTLYKIASGGSASPYVIVSTSTYVGACDGKKLIMDSTDNIYITGSCGATWGGALTKHAYGGTYGSNSYVAKFDKNMTLLWNTFYGTSATSGSVYITGIALNKNNLIVGGNTYGALVDTYGSPNVLITSSNTFSSAQNGAADGFIMALKTSDGAFVSNTYTHANSYVSTAGVAIDKAGLPILSGSMNMAGITPIGTPVGTPPTSGQAGFLAEFGAAYSANLASLAVSSGDKLSPVFSNKNSSTSYNVLVGGSEVTLIPTATDGGTLRYKVGSDPYTDLTSASFDVPFSGATTTVLIEVVSSDKATTQTYTLTLMPISTNNNLSGLQFSGPTGGIPIAPSFLQATTAYTAGVPYSTVRPSFNATLVDTKSTMTFSLNGADAQTTTSGSWEMLTLLPGVNTLAVAVTAEDGGIKTYTTTVTRATLTALSLSAGTPLTPAFSDGASSYTLSVPYTTASTTVTATAADTGTDPSISLFTSLNGGTETALTSGTASGALALLPGQVNTVDVISRDTATNTLRQTYRVSVTRGAASSPNLSGISLTVPTTSLNTTFAVDTLAYTATVNYAFASIDVTPTLVDPLSSITSRVKTDSFTAQVSGTPKTFALAVGDNKIDFLVTSQDPAITQTYTVTVTRAAAAIDASLSSLTLNHGTLNPVFVSGTTTYTAGAPYSVSSLDITPACSDAAYATLQVKNNANTYTDTLACGVLRNIPLSVGDNLIDIKVTAQDGSTTQTYSLTFTRAAVSVNNDLSNLTLNSGTLSPAFDAATNAYTVTLNYAIASIQATPTLADSLSNIQSRVNSGTYAAQASAVSKTFALTVGDNPIDFKVTAEDGTIKTYTVTVTRGAASSDATLSSKTISAGTLSAPIFVNSYTDRYIAYVPFPADKTDVSWVCSNAYASVTVQQENGPYIAATCSATKSYNLAVGVNNIYINVTAQNGSSNKTYWLYIDRAAASTNNSLSGLSLTNPTTSLSTTFAPTTYVYYNASPNLNYHFSSIDITPTLADSLSSILSRVNGGSYSAHTSGTSHTFALTAGSMNQIDFKVTAENSSIKTYTVLVTRQSASNVATLTNLTLSSGSLNTAFNANTHGYTSGWIYTADSLAITPTCSDPYATYQVKNTTTGGAYTSATVCGSLSSSLPLNVGNNTIDILVTAQNGTNTETYTVNYTRYAASTNNNLMSLSLSAPNTSLNTAFSASTTSYTATVNHAFTSIDATPALAEWVNSLQSRVNTDSFSAHTNNSSKTFALNEGANTIEFLVTAEDPATLTKTYSVTVTRQAASSVATLSGLTLSAGTLSPTFAGATTSYSAGVSSTTTSLNITPACSDTYATLQVQNNAGGYSSATCGTAKSIPLSIGPNVIEILVTAQDGSTTKSYTVTVTRATLTDLVLGAGALSPAFAGGTNSYGKSVPWITTSTTVTATLSDPANTLLYFKLNGGSEIALSSGTASDALALDAGANSIEVLTRDKTSSALLQTYTVTVTRTVVSTNRDLSALTLTVPTTSLNTTFAPGTTGYTATVNNYFSSINATPTLADSLATLQSRVNSTSFTAQTSGASKTFALNVGDNTIDFLVTAENGSPQTYTVTVTRQPASNDASLSGLTLSAGTLSPSFASGTTSGYTASALYAVTSLNITPACSDAYAIVQVQNNSGGYTSATCGSAKSIPLTVGSNAIDIKVTAQDGTTIKTYSLTFTRAPASTNNNLSTLIVSAGSISPAFSAGTSAYTLSLPYATATTTLTATRADATATLKLSLNGGTETTLSSGTASASQSLRTGDNTLVVKVTAEDGSIKSYTVTVTRAALSGLTVSDDSGVRSLTPTFTATTSSYSLNTTSTSITVTAARADGGTSLSYSLNGGTETALTSGTPSAALNLLAGVPNTLDVIVRDTATSALRQTYRITISRPAILTAPADAIYYGGQPIDFTVTFGRTVTVDTTGGKPSIALTVGDSTHPDATYQAEYFSGSGTTSLTFRWNVASAFDDNGIAAASTIVLNGGTLTDSTGDSAILSLTSVTTSGVKVIGGLTLTLATGGYGSGTLIANPLPSIISTYYMPGTVVTLTATPDTSASPHSRFIGWSGDLISTTNPENITINSNMSINAWFDQVGILRVDPSYDPTSPGWGVTRFATVQSAIKNAGGGDKVVIAPGTYNEDITLPDPTNPVNITLAPGPGVKFGGTFTQNGGTLLAPTGTLTFGGSFIQTGGSFDPNGGTVVFDGNNPVITSGRDGPLSFYNLTMAGTGTLTTTGPITVSNLLTIASGSYNPTNGSSIHSLTIGPGGSLVLDSDDILDLSGDFINSSVFNPNQGALNVAGNFTNTSTGTFCPTGGSVDVNGTFTNSGTVCGSGGSLNLAGNFINNGPFNKTGGKVTFDGGSAQSISGSTTPTFYKVDVDKAGGTLTGTVAINVSDTLDIIDGVFDPFTGSVFNKVITEIDGELALTSADTVSIASLDNKGVFSPTGGTANISGNLTNSGTIKPSGGSINIGGNLENNGSFEPTGGTVSLNGSGDQAITGSSPTIFNNLTINNTGTGTIPTTQPVTVRGDLIVNDGSFKPATVSDFNNITINTNGSLDFSTGTFSVSGDFTNNGTFVPGTGTGTVVFDGTGTQAISGSSTTNFVNLTLSGTGPVTTSQAVNVSGSLTVNQGDFRPACGSTFNAVLVMPGASITTGVGCTITINSPMVSNPIPDQTAQEDVAFSLTFASDTFTTQSGTLTYSARLANNNPLPTWLHFDPATRVFSGTPAAGSSGDLEIKVSTTNGSATTSDTFIIRIAGWDSHPPIVVYPIGDQVAKEGMAFSFSFPVDTFVSPSISTLNYTASGLPAWLTLNSATRTFSGTPPVGSASINGGVLNLSLITTDASGGSASDEFIIRVYSSSTNLSPVLGSRLHDQVAIAGTVFTFTTPAGFIADPEHDSLTYSATLASGDALPAWLSFNPGSHNFSGTPAASDVGKLLIRVTVNDGNGHTANDVFLLGISSTDLQTLYLPMTPAGAPAMSNVGQVVRLPAPVPADEHYYLVVTLGVPVPPLPNSSSTFDLNFERDIKLYDGSGNRVTTLSGPINICFMLTESQWAQYSTQQPSIGTAPDLLSPWTLEDGTLYASSHEICASFSHLSLYDLFFELKPNADKKMPNTGFAPNRITSLPVQPAILAYTKLSDLWLEIPSQKLQANIIGVPEVNGNWDVSWLGNDTGWLNGTAFPTWEGNSVLTAHATDSNGLPGPFANLKDLKYGDQIIVHLNGQQYTFEVRNTSLARTASGSYAFKHLEGNSYLTLITCQGYNVTSDSYLFRRIVRAVLVSVK